MTIQVRDPVHNFIELNSDETALINTRVMQRLRDIKQLALALLVYPGAVHTRFDHSLGVLHVATKMAKTVEIRENTRVIRLAALLHDVGHGPFSHVSEYALEMYANRDTLGPEQKKEKIHELITASIIKNDREIETILGKRTCEEISDLLMQGHGESINRSIVSGPLDADKQDYLLRDSYFCGVQYGVFDLHQLHRSLCKFENGENSYLSLRPDGVHAMEQYVLAKYYLTTSVYRHKVRLITDQMIFRAIVLGIDVDGIAELRRLYSFDNSSDFIHNYLEWNDHRFMREFAHDDKYADTQCQTLLKKLQTRQLLKRVFQARAVEFTPQTRDQLQGLGKREFSVTRNALEKDIAERLSRILNVEINGNFVIVHAFDTKSVKEMSRNDEAPVLINKDPKPVSFEEESGLFASISEGFREGFVEVYAPVEWKTRQDRDKAIKNAQESVREAIEKHCTLAGV